jgi:tRNA-splicing ligase RtcB
MTLVCDLAAAARAAGDCVWEMPPDAKSSMRVPARIYASDALFAQMDQGVFEQVTNVACLPGIVRASLCMPDGHSGYGFPIGGAAAFRADVGVISRAASGSTSTAGCLLRTSRTE